LWLFCLTVAVHGVVLQALILRILSFVLMVACLLGSGSTCLCWLERLGLLWYSLLMRRKCELYLALVCF